LELEGDHVSEKEILGIGWLGLCLKVDSGLQSLITFAAIYTGR